MSSILFECNLKAFMPTCNIPWAVVWSSICTFVIAFCVAMTAVRVELNEEFKHLVNVCGPYYAAA